MPPVDALCCNVTEKLKKLSYRYSTIVNRQSMFRIESASSIHDHPDTWVRCPIRVAFHLLNTYRFRHQKDHPYRESNPYLLSDGISHREYGYVVHSKKGTYEV